MPWRHHLVAKALLVGALLGGCVQHPVGPARSAAGFEAKARTTAESAVSAVQTVALLAETASEGKAFGPFAGVLASEQEDVLVGLQGTFGSIQPPDDASDRLRADLLAALSRASDHVAGVRIDVRRGELGNLDRWLDELAADRDTLTTFTGERG